MAGPTDHVLTFSGAETQPLNVRGRFIRVLEATSAVYFSIDGGSELKRRVGQEVNYGDQFTRIQVRATAAQSVRLVVADVSQPDDIGDNTIAAMVTVANTTAEPLPIEENAADQLTALADVALVAGAAAATIAPANVARIGVLVSVPLDLPAGIRIGTGASATSGVRLTAGDVAFLPIVGAVTAFSEAANTTDQTVNATDVERT